MRSIATNRYIEIKKSQRIYDPDFRDETLDVQNEVETIEIEDPTEAPIEDPTEEGLPTITPDDLGEMIEDGTEEPISETEEIEEPEGYPEFPSAFQAIRWAKNNQEVMRITYQCDKGGRIIKRDVECHGDFYAKTTHRRILVTYDETIDDIRAFIVMNIHDYEFTGEKFEPKFNFSVVQHNFRRRTRRRKERNNKLRYFP